MEADSLENRRTVFVSGVPDVLPVSRMIDKLTIHFQSFWRSHGGDVELVKFPTNMDGVAFVTFDKAQDNTLHYNVDASPRPEQNSAVLLADAERVVQKEQHIMADNQLPENYLLTVFPFTSDVFVYVSSAVVDLSAFGPDQAALIRRLQAAHRSLRFRPLLQQRKATIEGPFAAVRALRGDLIRRASRLKATISAHAAAVEPTEAPVNPRVVSHRSVSCRASEAKLEPAGSNSSSAPLQTTGEGPEVHSSLSNAKPPNASWRQKVPRESWTGGRAGSRLDPRQEIHAGVRSSSSGEASLPAEGGEDDASQKHTRPDRRSATNTSRRSSPAATANTRATGAEDPDETCIWVDLYTFRYVERFDRKEFDRCLRGLDASAEDVKGADLVRIGLTNKQNSRTASGVQQALENLKTLVDFWQSTLRVHQICHDEARQPEKKKLAQICDEANKVFSDVLYMMEDSCVTVIGPSVSSHLFCRMVEDTVGQFQHTVP